MRLMAQSKLGFYPCSTHTIDFVCRQLTVACPEQTYLLDPCCGKGVALADLGRQLNVPTKHLYGVELDSGRAEAAAEVLGNVLNASFFDVRIVPVQSFSLCWLNPPYENEPKQGDERGLQMETSFLQTAARLTIQDGLVILHCPEDRMTQEVRQTAAGYLYDLHLVRLPQELRPYRESLLVGKKRKEIERYVYHPEITLTDAMPPWTIPPGEPIKKFQKSAPTDTEIEEALASSSLLKPFTESRKVAKLRPVLPLGPGHLGLVLAAGFLDGYTAPPGYEPHVVRGIALKVNKLVKEETTESEDGKETTTQTYRESIRLKIRAVTADGTIKEMA